jgi:hypothetical protein
MITLTAALGEQTKGGTMTSRLADDGSFQVRLHKYYFPRT